MQKGTSKPLYFNTIQWRISYDNYDLIRAAGKASKKRCVDQVLLRGSASSDLITSSAEYADVPLGLDEVVREGRKPRWVLASGRLWLAYSWRDWPSSGRTRGCFIPHVMLSEVLAFVTLLPSSLSCMTSDYRIPSVHTKLTFAQKHDRQLHSSSLIVIKVWQYCLHQITLYLRAFAVLCLASSRSCLVLSFRSSA